MPARPKKSTRPPRAKKAGTKAEVPAPKTKAKAESSPARKERVSKNRFRVAADAIKRLPLEGRVRILVEAGIITEERANQALEARGLGPLDLD